MSPGGNEPAGRRGAITLKQFEAFIAVAELGSFVRAAERLATTQPNISARIAALERLAGARLIARGAGAVALTDAGQRLLPHARAALAAVERFVLEARGPQGLAGTLRLGVSELVAHTWLPALIGALGAAMPQVTVELMVDLSANLSRALFAHRLDLALQNGPFDRSAAGDVPLGRAPFAWVAATGLAGPGTPLDALLPDHPVLVMARGTRPHAQITRHVARAFPGTRLTTCSDISVCRQMARAGLGVACLPAAMVRADVAAGALVPLGHDWLPDALDFHARFAGPDAPAFVPRAAELARQVAADHMIL